MTYSEAIRMGGVLSTRQVTGVLHTLDGGSCAHGGALKAAGSTLVHGADQFTWIIEDREYACPDCRLIIESLLDAVFHLNDRHLWTRDQIADWVAEQERQVKEQERKLAPGRRRAGPRRGGAIHGGGCETCLTLKLRSSGCPELGRWR